VCVRARVFVQGLLGLLSLLEASSMCHAWSAQAQSCAANATRSVPCNTGHRLCCRCGFKVWLGLSAAAIRCPPDLLAIQQVFTTFDCFPPDLLLIIHALAHQLAHMRLAHTSSTPTITLDHHAAGERQLSRACHVYLVVSLPAAMALPQPCGKGATGMPACRDTDRQHTPRHSTVHQYGPDTSTGSSAESCTCRAHINHPPC
jgi:hypothetical protein